MRLRVVQFCKEHIFGGRLEGRVGRICEENAERFEKRREHTPKSVCERGLRRIGISNQLDIS
jgi:hypothetical protein